MDEMASTNMSNEEVIEVLKGIVFYGFDRTTPKEREALDLAITALEKRRQGEWKRIIEEDNDVECPFCGFQEDSIYYNFCPNCGADMQGGKVK